jgi:hypothetical protein
MVPSGEPRLYGTLVFSRLPVRAGQPALPSTRVPTLQCTNCQNLQRLYLSCLPADTGTRNWTCIGGKPQFDGTVANFSGNDTG